MNIFGKKPTGERVEVETSTLKRVDSAGGAGNSKSLSVPTGRVWVVRGIRASYISDATAGNRRLVIELQDNTGSLVYQKQWGANQAASLTRTYYAYPDMSDETAFDGGNSIRVRFGPILLPAGWSLIVRDRSNVSANDTLTFSAVVDERSDGSVLSY